MVRNSESIARQFGGDSDGDYDEEHETEDDIAEDEGYAHSNKQDLRRDENHAGPSTVYQQPICSKGNEFANDATAETATQELDTRWATEYADHIGDNYWGEETSPQCGRETRDLQEVASERFGSAGHSMMINYQDEALPIVYFA